jgi:hypothetical protein
MMPQCREYLISIKSIFIFAVELVRTACKGDIAVELHQSNGHILSGNLVLFEQVANCIFLEHDKVEHQLDKVSANVWIRANTVLR